MSEKTTIKTIKDCSLEFFGKLKSYALKEPIDFIGIFLFISYFLSMAVWPWIDGNFEWDHVQAVWDRWQALNVGVLAFSASVILLKSNKYNAKQQRIRDFRAAKAFLPEALSELTAYFKESAKFLYPKDVPNPQYSRSEGASYIINIHPELPQLPQEYKKIFQECIRHAEPSVGDYLANILMILQFHHARMEVLAEERNRSPFKKAPSTYLYRLGQLLALVNRTFPFARDNEELNTQPLTWGDFENAYNGLKIEASQIKANSTENLEEYTKRVMNKI